MTLLLLAYHHPKNELRPEIYIRNSLKIALSHRYPKIDCWVDCLGNPCSQSCGPFSLHTDSCGHFLWRCRSVIGGKRVLWVSVQQCMRWHLPHLALGFKGTPKCVRTEGRDVGQEANEVNSLLWQDVALLIKRAWLDLQASEKWCSGQPSRPALVAACPCQVGKRPHLGWGVKLHGMVKERICLSARASVADHFFPRTWHDSDDDTHCLAGWCGIMWYILRSARALKIAYTIVSEIPCVCLHIQASPTPTWSSDWCLLQERRQLEDQAGWTSECVGACEAWHCSFKKDIAQVASDLTWGGAC